jgi:hypothetical protein
LLGSHAIPFRLTPGGGPHGLLQGTQSNPERRPSISQSPERIISGTWIRDSSGFTSLSSDLLLHLLDAFPDCPGREGIGVSDRAACGDP